MQVEWIGDVLLYQTIVYKQYNKWQMKKLNNYLKMVQVYYLNVQQ